MDLGCWGNLTGWLPAPEGRYLDVGMGGAICGVTIRGRLSCALWSEQQFSGGEHFLRVVPEGNDFRRVVLGGEHACALRADGSIACWGKNTWGGTNVPAGRFIDLGAGDGFTCAVEADGTVSCWGALPNGTPVIAPKLNDAVAVDAEGVTACALRATGDVLCWGFEELSFETGAQPSGRIRQLSVGVSHACGVTEDDRVACWGKEALDVPEELR